MDDIERDTDLALAAFEGLARRLIVELLARDRTAGATVLFAFEEAIDGTPGHSGAWFRIGSGAVMARLVEIWERLRRVALAPQAG